MRELIENVIQWGHQRNLIDGNTADRQFTKTWEEVLELKAAIEDKNEPEIVDAIGDITVTLILLAAIQNLSFEGCLEHAYNVIKDRTGKTVDGVFIKDGDTPEMAAKREESMQQLDEHDAAISQHVFRSVEDLGETTERLCAVDVVRAMDSDLRLHGSISEQECKALFHGFLCKRENQSATNLALRIDNPNRDRLAWDVHWRIIDPDYDKDLDEPLGERTCTDGEACESCQ